MSRPRERRAMGDEDLFRSRLDQIINMTDELVRLAVAIDWPFLEDRFGEAYADSPGIRDISRQILDDEDLKMRRPLYLAGRVLEQRQKQRGRKVHNLHAPEVECIGKSLPLARTGGKARAPYEFGVKVFVTTTLKRSKCGQFAACHGIAGKSL